MTSKESQLATLVTSQAADLTSLETHLKELTVLLRNLKASQKKADKLASGLVPQESKKAAPVTVKKAAPPAKKQSAPSKKPAPKRTKKATPVQSDSDSSDSD